MKATTRVNIINTLFMSTFLVAFSSVALSSILPCPLHVLDSESPIVTDEQKKVQNIKD